MAINDQHLKIAGLTQWVISSQPQTVLNAKVSGSNPKPGACWQNPVCKIWDSATCQESHACAF